MCERIEYTLPMDRAHIDIHTRQRALINICDLSKPKRFYAAHANAMVHLIFKALKIDNRLYSTASVCLLSVAAEKKTNASEKFPQTTRDCMHVDSDKELNRM